MENFFAGNYAGPAFQLFGAAHLGALLALALLNIYLFRFKHADERARSRVRWILALILWSNEIAWHAWNYAVGKWTIQTMLPLHLCSVLVWAGAWMLVTKNYHIYEFMYLLGIGGAIQALATPDLGIYGFPHFRFFPNFHFTRLDRHLCHLHDRCRRVSSHMGFDRTCGGLDERLRGHRVLHQQRHRQQLPDDQS